ncbi:MAG: NAD(P)-binding protein [Myxococcota bacterium]
MARVAIVGAGIAGLRVGRRLETAGHSVALFDKARGPSGRMATRRLEFGRFDHGAQYFTARTSVFAAQVEDWIARGVAARWTPRIASLDRGQVQAEERSPDRYVGTPSMSAVARDLAAGLALETGVRIAAVKRVGVHWLLVTDDDHPIDGFDVFVSAVPAPQAVSLLACSPPLERLAHATAYRACHAAMIEFEAPLPVAFDAAFVHRSPLGWIAHQASKPGRAASNGWVLHSTPEWSEGHLDLAADRVGEALCAALGEAIGRPLPARRGIAVHRWLFARVEKRVTAESTWDAAQRVGVCGDWLAGERVEDAYRSGDRLADAMLASLGSSGAA